MKKIIKCQVCGWTAEVEYKNEEDLTEVRALSLPCGHQGLFKLLDVNEKEK